MNLSVLGGAGVSRGKASVYMGNLPFLQGGALKSTQEKAERRQKADRQIEYWENQKENLKNMECNTLEEIARKLEQFHTYEDEISAAKAAYNQEQMFHTLDEAFEQGEKNAEAAEKTAPKTKEERKEELKEEIIEELTGTEQSEGLLEEVLEEAGELIEEMQEEISEETTEDMAARAAEDLKQLNGMEAAGEGDASSVSKQMAQMENPPQADGVTDMEEWIKRYRPLDIRI